MLFREVSINYAARAAIGTATCVILAGLLMLVTASQLLKRQLAETVEVRLMAQVERELAVSERLLDYARLDAKTLAEGPLLADYVAAGQNEEARARLKDNLARLLRVGENYYQGRFLDAGGHEVVRVEFADGGFSITPDEQLQDKSRRDYFKALQRLAPGETLAMRVSLNREFGEIEQPPRPTIRLLSPVHDETGAFVGGVVLNMDARRVFPPSRSGATEFRVVLPDGSYGLHPDAALEHGVELQTGEGLAREFWVDVHDPAFHHPGTLRMTGGETAVLAAQGWLVSGDDPDAARWRLIASQPEAVALAGVAKAVSRLNASLVLLAGLAGVASLFGAREGFRITRKARALSEAARRVADGDHTVKVPADGDDALSDAAEAFNRMTRRVHALLEREAASHEELAQVNAELLRSNGELENFARVTSHDLKSPLRPLTVLPDWIEEDLTEIPEGVQDHLDEMRRQAARMSDLIDGLLKYSLAGAGESRVAPVDVRDLVQTIVDTLGTGGSFGFDLDLPEDPVRGVRTEMDVVIRNLVQNAIKHHDQGAGRIGIAVRDLGTMVQIAVSDDGPGIPEAYREKVLDPLVTLKSQDEGGGSGLGLAIVAKIARRWDGSVTVVSTDGERGTTIVVHLSVPGPAEVQEAA